MASFDEKIVRKGRAWAKHGRKQPMFWEKNERKSKDRTDWHESVKDLFRKGK